jgi:hypothetical protein
MQNYHSPFHANVLMDIKKKAIYSCYYMPYMDSIESPALWFNDFSTTLVEFDLYPVPSVNCLYTNSWLILMFYVDDIIIAYSKEHIEKV